MNNSQPPNQQRPFHGITEFVIGTDQYRIKAFIRLNPPGGGSIAIDSIRLLCYAEYWAELLMEPI